MDICEHCKKPKPVLFTIAAAPEVPTGGKTDPKLRSQLAAEGRGASMGELRICTRCYLDGYPDRKPGVAA